jgi:hypothetical protein
MYHAPEDRLNASIEYFITHSKSGPVHHVTASSSRGIFGVSKA